MRLEVRSLDSTRLPGLDTLRAVAILAVMSFHLSGLLPESWRPVDRFGWMGVDLFFVLSGYLIGWQLLKPYVTGGTSPVGEFYRRRVFRILPAYCVVLALYFLWPVWREQDGISPMWQFVTFTENLFVDYANNQAFSHVWSLCVEEHFYLVLPLLVMAMMRRPSAWRTASLVAALVALGIGIRSYVLVHTLQPLGAEEMGIAYIEKIYYPTWTRLDGLTVGVVLACVRAFRPAWWESLRASGHASLFAGVTLVGVSMWLFVDRFDSVTGAAAWGTVVGFPLLSVGLGLVVASSVSRNGALGRWNVPGARMVATLAFSLYLTHKAAVHLDQEYLPGLTGGRGAEAFAVYMVSCLMVAGLLYLGVERPFLLLRDRLDHRPIADVKEEMLSEPAL